MKSPRSHRRKSSQHHRRRRSSSHRSRTRRSTHRRRRSSRSQHRRRSSRSQHRRRSTYRGHSRGGGTPQREDDEINQLYDDLESDRNRLKRAMQQKRDGAEIDRLYDELAEDRERLKRALKRKKKNLRFQQEHPERYTAREGVRKASKGQYGELSIARESAGQKTPWSSIARQQCEGTSGDDREICKFCKQHLGTKNIFDEEDWHARKKQMKKADEENDYMNYKRTKDCTKDLKRMGKFEA